MSKGKLKPEDEDCIQQNYTFIKENIEALDIVDCLFQWKVISFDDKEHIHGEKNRKERNEVLLRRLLNSGPGESFNYFLKSLETDYKYVLDKLQRTARDIEEKKCQEEEIKKLTVKLDELNLTLEARNKELKNVNKEKDLLNSNLQTRNRALNKVIEEKDQISSTLHDRNIELEKLNKDKDLLRSSLQDRVEELKKVNEEKDLYNQVIDIETKIKCALIKKCTKPLCVEWRKDWLVCDPDPYLPIGSKRPLSKVLNRCLTRLKAIRYRGSGAHCLCIDCVTTLEALLEL